MLEVSCKKHKKNYGRLVFGENHRYKIIVKNKSLTLTEPGYAKKRLVEVPGIWTSEKIRNLENFVGEFFEDCHSASQLLIVDKIQYNRNYADIMAEPLRY